MKQKYRISIIITAVVLLLPFTAYYFVSKDRAMFKLPTYEGSFTVFADDITKHYKDNKPFIEQATQPNAKANLLFFHEASNEVILGKNGWLFLNRNGIFESMQGIDTVDPTVVESVASRMQAIERWSEDQGIQVVFAVGPNKESIYFDQINSPRDYSQYENYSSMMFIEQIESKTDIVIENPLEQLRAERNNHQLYYKSDTHWNELGGYVSFGAIMSAIDSTFVPIPIDDLIVTTKPKDGGDLARMSHLKDSYKDDFFYKITNYKENVTSTDVSEAKEGEALKLQVHLSDANDKRMLIVGDSFSQAMLPFFSKEFGSLTTVHRDNFEKTHFDQAQPDTIVILTVERTLYTTFDAGLAHFMNEMGIEN